jgi:hypothetical protein
MQRLGNIGCKSTPHPHGTPNIVGKSGVEIRVVRRPKDGYVDLGRFPVFRRQRDVAIEKGLDAVVGQNPAFQTREGRSLVKP